MKGFKILGGILLAAIAVAVGVFSLRDQTIAVLQPVGNIGQQQYDLIVFSTVLMLVIVLPVFALTAFVAWKYREGNTKAKYSPNWDRSRLAESIWWGFPLLIILILSVVIWKSSHDLDPYKPLASDEKPLTIQVVAMQWKWLFIYPEQNIASVNYVHIPVNTPVNFKITADAPMNSLWIPQLGGQVYAMAGMETKLHLDAKKEGIYEGSSANISGRGFAGMRFKAEASSRSEFDGWVHTLSLTQKPLDSAAYRELSQPSEYVQPKYYAAVDDGLFESIIMKYMAPNEGASHGQH